MAELFAITPIGVSIDRAPQNSIHKTLIHIYARI